MVEKSNIQFSESMVKNSSSVVMYNIVCYTANKEYDYLAQKCRKFTLKARDATIQVSLEQGKSNSCFTKLVDGQSWSEDLINFDSIHFYFQSSANNGVLEIFIWS
jgi:hypothetical protein